MTQNDSGGQPPRSTGQDGSPPGSDADACRAATDRGAWPYVECRVATDRRQEPTPFWSAFTGRRRRRQGRRAGEREYIYVDRFTRRDVLLVLSILLLNIFDALFTLIWLRRGGAEGNPVMAWLLEIGDGAFLAQKCLVVGLWLLLLVVHKNFPLARIGLWSLAGIYSLLILYHFALIASGVDPRQGPGHESARLSDEASEQSRHGSLDAQWPLAEPERGEPRRHEQLELVIAPTALRADRE